MSKSKVEVRPKDIAKSLDKISAWVRGVRSAVLKMDQKATVTLGRPGGLASAAPPGMLDGCPPVPRPKPVPIKKKKKNK
jgi:hypothetical protein